MVNIFAVFKPLLRGLMKLAGVRPQRVEIEPGTVMNFWVPNETPKKSKNTNESDTNTKPNKPNKPAVVFIHGFAADGIITWQFQVLALARNSVAKGLRKLGVERCTLVGFSYGGMVGFKMAEMYPDLVESMVFTSCVMALTKSISDAALERIGLKSWSEFLLPDSVQGVKLLLTRATYKLPWIPNFIMFDNRKEKAELLKALVIDDKDFTITHHPQV
uniref:AB hydrolase-1 domain-containing protein n=1 Tax=Fagus sylvatica TaxID=28930 RepID=A0A2N9ELB5_FAGSY